MKAIIESNRIVVNTFHPSLKSTAIFGKILEINLAAITTIMEPVDSAFVFENTIRSNAYCEKDIMYWNSLVESDWSYQVIDLNKGHQYYKNFLQVLHEIEKCHDIILESLQSSNTIPEIKKSIDISELKLKRN